MLDLARGPLLVGVADHPAALVRCAALEPEARVADLVEARLDLFPVPALDECADACARLESAGTPVLITLRTAAQGGRFAAGEPERLTRFRNALAIASWADVEDDASILADVAAMVRARPGGQLVVSHHDFARTPPLEELLAIVDRCHAIPGAIAKLATAVKSEADRRTLLDLLVGRPARSCVIGMEASEALRLELAARGSLLCYGYLGEATAPGQLSVAETHARLLVESRAYAARKGFQSRSRE